MKAASCRVGHQNSLARPHVKHGRRARQVCRAFAAVEVEQQEAESAEHIDSFG